MLLALVALSAPPLALAQSYPDPLVNTAQVTLPAGISDPVPGNNTAQDSNALAAASIDAVDDTATTAYGTAVATVVGANDVASNGTLGAIGANTQGTSGAVTCSGTGSAASCTYTPNAGFSGLDSYTYTICLASPNESVCDTATVSVVVGPDAVDDVTSTTQNTPVGGDVSVNDVYPPGSVFAATGTPVGGSVVVNADGTYTFTPAPGFTGAASFQYTLCLAAPNGSVCDTATVSVSVGAASIDAVDDTATTAYGTAVATVVGANDVASNGTLGAIGANTQGTSGAVTCSGTGSAASCTYTPNAGFSGLDSYTYTICLASPNESVCDTATVSVVVGPDAVDDVTSTTQNTPVGGDVSVNDVYPPGSVFAATGTPVGGSVVVNADGTYTFTPAPGFTGAASFQYTLCLAAPNGSVCDTATVSVSVGAASIDAVDDTATTAYGTAVATVVGANDVASNGTLGAIGANTQGTSGAVTCSGTGSAASCTYTPNAGFSGLDSYTYTICLASPNESVCDTATVSVSVGAAALVSDLSVVKTLLTGSPAAAGSVVSYQLVVGNAGPDVAVGASITDTVPAQLTNVTWTCTASGSSSCGTASGSGNAISLTATLGVGAGNEVTVLVSGTAPASGTIGSNTVVVGVPDGTSDPNPDDNTDTVPEIPVTPAALVSDLSVVKTLLTGSPAAAGSVVSYQLVVGNAGPDVAVGASITDTVPAQLTNVTWTCTASGSSSCGTASGSGNAISLTATLGVGAGNEVTVLVSGTAPASGTIGSNTVVVGVPDGTSDPNPDDNTDTVPEIPVTPAALVSDLSVVKTLLTGSPAAAGSVVSYQLVVGNAGPDVAVGASITDTVPAQLTNVTWTCTASGSSSCGTASGSGNAISLTATLGVGAGNEVTVLVSGTAPASGTIGSNTVVVGVPDGTSDPNPDDNTDTVPEIPVTPAALVSDLSVVKTLLTGSPAAAGSVVSYQLVVGNAGPDVAVGASITDTVPAQLTNVTWTCTASGSSSCGTASGSGNAISLTATLGVGAGNEVTVLVSGTAPASGTIGSNTVVVGVPDGTSDPNPDDNTDTVPEIPVTPAALVSDLSVVKTLLTGSPAAAGSVVSYQLVVGNAGPDVAVGASITDTVPAQLTNVTWTCTASGSSSCGTASGSGNAISLTATLGVGAGNEVTVLVSGTAPASGTIGSNTVVVGVPDGTSDPNPDDNTDTVPEIPVTPAALVSDLSVVKTLLTGSPAAAGSVVSYQLVVGNAGPDVAVGASITDTVPAQLTNVTWTCTASGSSSCGTASGSGNAISLTATLGVGAGNEVTVLVSGTAPASGTIGSNTVVVGVPDGTSDPNPDDNTDTVPEIPVTPAALVSDLSVVKTLLTGSPAAAGSVVSYQLVVGNAGPDVAVGASITDTVPAQLTNVTWTCTASGSSSCGTASGSGNAISLTATLGVGAGNEVTVLVSGTAPASGTIGSNTVVVGVPDGTSDPNPDDNTDTVPEIPVTPAALVSDLSVVKTLLTGSPAAAGSVVSYQLVVGNAGPDVAVGASITDTVPAQLTNVTWTCTASGSSSCGTASGSGNAISLTATLGVGAGNEVTVLVSGTAPASGTIGSNTVVVGVPDGTSDPNPDDNTDTVPEIPVTPAALVSDLSVVKTLLTGSPAAAGSVVSYQLVVGNAGPDVAVGASITDTVPAQLTNVTWTCTASGSSSCGTASGSGNAISLTATLGVGAGNEVTVLVSGTAPASGTIGSNTVVVGVPDGTSDPNPDDNTDTVPEIPVTPAALVIDAVDDSAGPVDGAAGATNVVNVLDNDTLGGVPIEPALVVLTPTNAGPLTIKTDGGVDVAANTPAGTYQASYRICAVASPGTCDTAIVTVIVSGDVVAVRLAKRALQRRVTLGELVRYTITADNTSSLTVSNAVLVDAIPAGFSYVEGSLEIEDDNGGGQLIATNPLAIAGLDLAPGHQATITYYLRADSGVRPGIHTNRAIVRDAAGRAISNEASADVEVAGDPLLEDSLIVGSVFDDRDGDGIQDPGERGVPGVRIASIEGLVMETDAMGRYHLVGVRAGSSSRGRLFILKVDASTLPEGTTFTTENPRVRRITPGMPVRFDFGVKLPGGEITGDERYVDIELGEVIFSPGSALIPDESMAMFDRIAATVREYGGGRITVNASADAEALAFQRAVAVQAEINRRLDPEIAARTHIDVGTDVAPGAPLVSLQDTIGLGHLLFDTDRASIRPQYRELIRQIAAAINARGSGVVSITGRADMRASNDYNRRLGLRRARAVMEAISMELLPEVKSRLRIEVDTPSGTFDADGG